MKERIRSLLRWLDAKLIGDTKTFPIYRSTDGTVSAFWYHGLRFIGCGFTVPEAAVQTFCEERFRVSVLLAAKNERCEDCGGGTFYLIAEFLNPVDEQWEPLLMLHEVNLTSIRKVFDDVDKFLTDVDRAA